jgi:serine/threonine-protein kinase
LDPDHAASTAYQNLAAFPAVGSLIASKYRVVGFVGLGGMGAVLAAHHEMLDERVAIKVVRPDVTGPEGIARFINEARAAIRIQNEHVVRVLEVGKLEDGRPYMAMELLEGRDLGSILAAHGPLPVVTAVDCWLQALEGIAHAHARGVIHRDLKPSNLFLARQASGTEIIKVLDFGISKAANSFGPGGAVRTSTQAMLGSPSYMSPEQVRSSKGVDPRSDIWSLGVTFHELLSGRCPFGGETPGAVFAAILESTPPSLRTIRSDVPPGLDAVLGRCLERDPNKRFAHAAELAHALLPFGSGNFNACAMRSWESLARASVVSAPFSAGGASSSPQLTPSPMAGAGVQPPPNQATAQSYSSPGGIVRTGTQAWGGALKVSKKGLFVALGSAAVSLLIVGVVGVSVGRSWRAHGASASASAAPPPAVSSAAIAVEPEFVKAAPPEASSSGDAAPPPLAAAPSDSVNTPSPTAGKGPATTRPSPKTPTRQQLLQRRE